MLSGHLAGNCGVIACQLLLSVSQGSDTGDAATFAAGAARGLVDLLACLEGLQSTSGSGGPGSVTAAELGLSMRNEVCQGCLLGVVSYSLTCLRRSSPKHPGACRREARGLLLQLRRLPAPADGPGVPAAGPAALGRALATLRQVADVLEHSLTELPTAAGGAGGGSGGNSGGGGGGGPSSTAECGPGSLAAAYLTTGLAAAGALLQEELRVRRGGSGGGLSEGSGGGGAEGSEGSGGFGTGGSISLFCSRAATGCGDGDAAGKGGSGGGGGAGSSGILTEAVRQLMLQQEAAALIGAPAAASVAAAVPVLFPPSPRGPTEGTQGKLTSSYPQAAGPRPSVAPAAGSAGSGEMGTATGGQMTNFSFATGGSNGDANGLADAAGGAGVGTAASCAAAPALPALAATQPLPLPHAGRVPPQAAAASPAAAGDVGSAWGFETVGMQTSSGPGSSGGGGDSGGGVNLSFRVQLPQRPAGGPPPPTPPPPRQTQEAGSTKLQPSGVAGGSPAAVATPPLPPLSTSLPWPPPDRGADRCEGAGDPMPGRLSAADGRARAAISTGSATTPRLPQPPLPLPSPPALVSPFELSARGTGAASVADGHGTELHGAAAGPRVQPPGPAGTGAATPAAAAPARGGALGVSDGAAAAASPAVAAVGPVTGRAGAQDAANATAPARRASAVAATGGAGLAVGAASTNGMPSSALASPAISASYGLSGGPTRSSTSDDDGGDATVSSGGGSVRAGNSSRSLAAVSSASGLSIGSSSSHWSTAPAAAATAVRGSSSLSGTFAAAGALGFGSVAGRASWLAAGGGTGGGGGSLSGVGATAGRVSVPAGLEAGRVLGLRESAAAAFMAAVGGPVGGPPVMGLWRGV